MQQTLEPSSVLETSLQKPLADFVTADCRTALISILQKRNVDTDDQFASFFQEFVEHHVLQQDRRLKINHDVQTFADSIYESVFRGLFVYNPSINKFYDCRAEADFMPTLCVDIIVFLVKQHITYSFQRNNNAVINIVMRRLKQDNWLLTNLNNNSILWMDYAMNISSCLLAPGSTQTAVLFLMHVVGAAALHKPWAVRLSTTESTAAAAADNRPRHLRFTGNGAEKTALFLQRILDELAPIHMTPLFLTRGITPFHDPNDVFLLNFHHHDQRSEKDQFHWAAHSAVTFLRCCVVVYERTVLSRNPRMIHNTVSFEEDKTLRPLISYQKVMIDGKSTLDLTSLFCEFASECFSLPSLPSPSSSTSLLFVHGCEIAECFDRFVCQRGLPTNMANKSTISSFIHSTFERVSCTSLKLFLLPPMTSLAPPMIFLHTIHGDFCRKLCTMPLRITNEEMVVLATFNDLSTCVVKRMFRLFARFNTQSTLEMMVAFTQKRFEFFTFHHFRTLFNVEHPTMLTLYLPPIGNFSSEPQTSLLWK